MAQPEKKYDRTQADIGNITNLGHINLNISDQRLGTHYYITGLGLTRDPFLNTGVRNMWVNVGMSQFHLPTGEPNVMCATAGLVVPGREALLARLAAVKGHLADTKFSFRETNDGVETTCPWGNRVTVHEPDPARFGRVQLGMAYVAFDVRPGTAERIARFYREVVGAPAHASRNGKGPQAEVGVGERQYFYFRETDAPLREFDGHHVQIYLANFSAPHAKLVDLGLITEESDAYQYRFEDLIDLDTREVLFTIEHETRSQTHPMFGRPLINRNPAQTNRDYKPGHDEMAWALA
jgi:catechol-2,3-dioxygenase